MAKQKIKMEYPKFMFGPNGKGKIFKSAAEVPAGWVDSLQEIGTIKPEITKGSVAAEKANAKPEEVTPAAPTGDLTEEEMFAFLDGKKMPDIWALAKELGLDKKGKKPELIKKIIAKLKTAQE